MALDPRQGSPILPQRFVEMVGNQAHNIIEGIDTSMRSAHDIHIARVGNDIYPMIYSREYRCRMRGVIEAVGDEDGEGVEAVLRARW